MQKDTERASLMDKESALKEANLASPTDESESK